ncbi:MAG: outer membrane lipoprotein-sorting protein [Cytophagales bacterium]|nr:outer membrane lipoprotein-sorting protein [Cytophagales bacterium]
MKKRKIDFLLDNLLKRTAGKLLLCFGFWVVPVLVQGQNAKEIVMRMDKKWRGDYVTQEMTMTIIRPTWQRSISMKTWGRGMDYSMVYITAPAKEKGQVFMKRNKEMWNWVPSIDRMIKLPPSMMMQSWMGSDFTNDDLIRESSVVRDYVHSIIGAEEILGRMCYKIKLIPKQEAAVVWGKVILWITKEDDLQLKIEFYDEDEYLVNTQLLSDIREMGGRVIPCKLEMIPADEEGKKTVIDITSADYRTEVKESFFSQQNMKRIR